MPAGWTWARLGDVVTFTRRPRDLAMPDVVPFLPMTLVPQRGGVVSTFQRRSKAAIRAATYFEEGDFVLARITPCFENGKQGVVRGLPGGWGLGSTELVAMRSDIVTTDYLAQVFRSSSVRNGLRRRMQGASGRLRLSRGAVADVIVPVPPLEVQEEIAEVVNDLFETIDAGQDAFVAAAEAVDDYERSLLVAAMTGRPRRGTSRGGESLLN